MVETNEGYRDPEEYFKGHNSVLKIEKSIKVLERLRRFGASRRLLDIGCGLGEMVRAAINLGFSAIGIETSAEFAAAAQRAYGITVLNRALDKVLFDACSFDVVTLRAVLEHVYRPAVLVAEINRILAPGGVLWLEVPNEASLYSVIAEQYLKFQHKTWTAHLSPTFAPFHVQGFTSQSLTRLLSENGFDVVDLRTAVGSAWPRHSGGVAIRVEYHAERAVHLIARLIPGASLNLEAIAVKAARRLGE